MQPPRRLYFIDNLRSVIILLVIVLHASLTYMVNAPDWWYVLDPGRSWFFDVVVTLVDVPIMLGLFFISGYFAFPSLERLGAGNFIKDKLLRIGIPWIFGSLVLAPPVAYMIYVTRGVDVPFLQFWSADFWGPMYQQSVYWYLGVLFFFFTLLSAAYSESSRLQALHRRIAPPSRRGILGFWILMTVAFFVLSFLWSGDEWRNIRILVYQPTRVPLYVGYFILGIYAERRGWFADGGYMPRLLVWLPLFVLSGFAYAGYRLSTAPADQTTLLFRLVNAGLFNAFCLTSLMAALAFFHRLVNGTGPVLGSLALNSYGIYYVHPLVLYPLAYLFVPVPISIYAKAALLVILTVLVSWGFSGLVLTRLPGLRRMFGSRRRDTGPARTATAATGRGTG